MEKIKLISLIIGAIFCFSLFEGQPIGILGIPLILFYFKDSIASFFNKQSKLYKINDFTKKEKEQEIFEQIADELDRQVIEKDLWIKAELKSNGDKKKQKSIYIKLRAERLRDLRWIKEEEEKRKSEEYFENLELNLTKPKKGWTEIEDLDEYKK